MVNVEKALLVDVAEVPEKTPSRKRKHSKGKERKRNDQETDLLFNVLE